MSNFFSETVAYWRTQDSAVMVTVLCTLSLLAAWLLIQRLAGDRDPVVARLFRAARAVYPWAMLAAWMGFWIFSVVATL